MKGMSGRLLKKLKSISTITTLKQGLVFQVNSPNQHFKTQTVFNDQEHTTNGSLREKVLDSPSLSTLVNDVDDEDDLFFETEDLTSPKVSNDLSPVKVNQDIVIPLDSEDGKASTVPLKDSSIDEEVVDTEKRPLSAGKSSTAPFKDSGVDDEEVDTETCPLLAFEEKCPPGGSESVIFYTTSLRGVRKTFEDCKTIRFLLESIRVVFYERDISMHMEFREELWKIIGGRVVPPMLFIKGRHIGGVDEVVRLHERGQLRKLLQGIPINPSNSCCNGCGGVRFVLCFHCNGSRKVKTEGQGNDLVPNSCLECNENGLVKCPICC